MKYTAFISYSHRDIVAVRKLHKTIERIRIPSYARNTEGQKSAFPIFRDETDLAGTVLTPAIEAALLDSRYLIVVCTPNSAESQWVGDEILFFLKNFGPQRVIPLFLDEKFMGQYPGFLSPLSDCAENALCMPSIEWPVWHAPKELADWILLPIEYLFLNPVALLDAFPKYRNRKIDLLRTLAVKLTDGKPEALSKRDGNSALWRWGLWLMVFIVLLVMLLDLFRTLPTTVYYRDLTFTNNMPEGVQQLQLWDTWFADDYYKCTQQRRMIIRSEHITTEKQPPLPGSWLVETPIMEYIYVDDFIGHPMISQTVMKDSSGQTLYVKNHAYSFADYYGDPNDPSRITHTSQVVDLTVSETAYEPFYLPDYVYTPTPGEATARSSCRLEQYYDENGCLTEVIFISDSAAEYLTTDETDTCWGIRFLYDASGNPESTHSITQEDMEQWLGIEMEVTEG